MEQWRDRGPRGAAKDSEVRSHREKTDELLRSLGADDIVIETVAVRMDDDHVQSVVEKLRGFAQDNPAVVLGALSALIAGGAIAAGTAVVRKNAKRRSRKSATAKSRSTSTRTTVKRGTAKRTAAKRTAAKRTLIEPHPGDKRFIRRDAKGRIKESVDVGRSLSADRKRKSKTRTKSGAGDKGDR